MAMQPLRRAVLAALALAWVPAATAHAGWSVGIGFGGPYYRPYYGVGFGYGYYRPYPVYVAPPPVIVQPAPVVQAVPVAQPVYTAPAPPPPPAPASAPAPLPPPAATATAIPAAHQADIDAYLQQLNSADERVRAGAMVQLGRLRTPRAVEPLTQALGGDRSPLVREAAARGLGLIAAPSSLPALQRAAQSDDDRDVRHSAAFAAEVIRANLPR